MEIPHKGGYGIVNYNPRRTYSPLVPKQDTFYVTDGSPNENNGTCILFFSDPHAYDIHGVLP